jgi:hypothetical protein
MMSYKKNDNIHVSMYTDQIIQLCHTMHDKGYNYVCFDKRHLTPSTDVTAGLGLSETPFNAFVFTQTKTLQSHRYNPTQNIIFANPIQTCLLSYKDERLKQFAYNNDDADIDIDPVTKYFWRGIASKLNASGIIVDITSNGNTFTPDSIIVWKGNALTDIINHS